MFKNENDFKKIADRLNIDTEPNPTHRENLRRQMLSTFNETRVGPWQKFGRTIMKRPITKLAVATAAIIIAILIAINHFGGSIDGASVAWADVVKVIKDVNNVSAESWRSFTVVGETEPLFEGKALKYFSRDLGYVDEQYVGEKCVLRGCGFFPKKLGVIILPDHKKYLEFKLNEEMLLLAQKLNPLDPSGMIEILGPVQWKRVGFREINGIKTEGFEIESPEIRNLEIADNFLSKYLLPIEKLSHRFWVDIDSSLPIEIEAEGVIGKGFLTCFNRVVAREVLYNIRWGVEVEPYIFEPNIPHDYNMIPSDSLEGNEDFFDKIEQ